MKKYNIFQEIGVDPESILSGISNSIYCLDKDGRSIWCNATQAQMMGLDSPGQVIGKTVYDLAAINNWDKAIPDSIRAIDLQVMSTGETRITEENVTINGREESYLTYKSPMRNYDGEIIGIVGMSVDITEKKEREKLQQEQENIKRSLKTMELLSASLAHELRTPLTGAIQGINGLDKHMPILFDAYHAATDANLPVTTIRASRFEQLQAVLTNTQHQLEQAQMILELSLSNVRMNKVSEASFKSTSIIETVERAMAEYPFASGEREKVVKLPKATEDFNYHGSVELTKHVIFNCLRNALYYIKAERRGEITISLNQTDKESQLILEDTARGISPEILPHIFEPFYTSREMGSGVGLAYCKMIMNAYNGDITCKSEFGEYTQFVLRFITRMK